jgi:hypothetical protein
MPKLGAEEFYTQPGQYNPNLTIQLLGRQDDIGREQTRAMTADMAGSIREQGEMWGKTIKDLPSQFAAGYDARQKAETNKQRARLRESEESRAKESHRLMKEREEMEAGERRRRSEFMQEKGPKGLTREQRQWQSEADTAELRRQIMSSNLSTQEQNRLLTQLQIKQLKGEEERAAKGRKIQGLADVIVASGNDPRVIDQAVNSGQYNQAEVQLAIDAANQKTMKRGTARRLMLPPEVLRAQEEKTYKAGAKVTAIPLAKKALADYQAAYIGTVEANEAERDLKKYLKQMGVEEIDYDIIPGRGPDYERMIAQQEAKMEEMVRQLEVEATTTGDPTLQQTVGNFKQQMATMGSRSSVDIYGGGNRGGGGTQVTNALSGPTSQPQQQNPWMTTMGQPGQPNQMPGANQPPPQQQPFQQPNLGGQQNYQQPVNYGGQFQPMMGNPYGPGYGGGPSGESDIGRRRGR